MTLGIVSRGNAQSLVDSAIAALDLKANLSGAAFTGATSVSANSASSALTVTQTGAGNAFVVEDSASTDSTPFVIDAAGNVLSGISTARGNFLNTAASTKLQVEGVDFTSSSLSIVRNGSVTPGAMPYIALGRSNGSTVLSNTVVTDGMGLGALSFQGSDGTELVEAASITGYVDGTPGTNDMPGRLVFSTTADGTSSPTERMRIDAAGVVSMPSCGLTIATGRKITADVDTGNIILWGGNSTGANLELYGGSHATNASLAVLDASETRFRSQNGGTEFMRIDSAGNVGIGTTASGAKLEVNPGSESNVLRLRANTSAIGILQFTPADASTEWGYVVGAAGSLGINHTAVTRLLVGGAERLRADATGVTVKAAVGLGYGTGAGGTVTQATSKSTAVTLNKPCGQITLNAAALAAGANVDFTLNNSLMSINDTVVANVDASIAGSPRNYVLTFASGPGAIYFNLTNRSAGSLSDALVINFAIIKGATA